MMRGALLLVLLAAFAAGCEKSQSVAYKSGHYAGKPDQPAWDNARFKNDRAEWERAIKARNLWQNEYARTGGKGA